MLVYAQLTFCKMHAIHVTPGSYSSPVLYYGSIFGLVVM